MPTAEKRLADVRAAINEVLTFGQSIQKDGRVLKLAELASLRMLENSTCKRLQQKPKAPSANHAIAFTTG